MQSKHAARKPQDNLHTETRTPAHKMSDVALEWLDYDGLAAWLSIPKPTLYSKVCRKEIPHHRLGPRMVRFNRQEILAWLDQHRVDIEPRASGPVYLDVEAGS